MTVEVFHNLLLNEGQLIKKKIGPICSAQEMSNWPSILSWPGNGFHAIPDWAQIAVF